MVKAIVGATWGDEGKGKITDLSAAKANYVVRFQGGSNAGHTIINDKGKFVLHQLPSGIFHENITNVLANGVALNIDYLQNELDGIAGAVNKVNLLISDRAQVLMPHHVLLDCYEEDRLAERQFGSTKSGIAPLYSDKYAKTGVQVWELFSDGLKQKVDGICEKLNIVFEHLYHKDPLNVDELYETLRRYGSVIEKYVADTSLVLNNAYREGKDILLEGQLGALKDTDHGIYPYVTSSSPLAGYAAVGAGLPPYAITDIVVVAKAYSSAVGEGPFVSELFGDEAQELRLRGGDAGEFGATTGRPRRVGFFDIVANRYGCRVQGATEIALTGIDVLSYLDEIPVCVAYKYDGIETTDFPTTDKLYRSTPVYKNLPGWNTDIRGITDYDKLPDNAKAYIAFIERELGVPITFISTGPKRDETMLRPLTK